MVIRLYFVMKKKIEIYVYKDVLNTILEEQNEINEKLKNYGIQDPNILEKDYLLPEEKIKLTELFKLKNISNS